MRTICIILIIIAGLAAYANCLDNRFIPDWDDKWLVMENSYIKEISPKNVTSILDPFIDRSSLGSEYLPVRDFSYMLDYKLYGLKPFGYHLTNVFFHILASILLFAILFRYLSDLRAALFGAILFAVHPIHTESVSWIAGRKDVLSLFFCMLSFYLYVLYESKTENKRRFILILSVFAYILAVFSKATAITLPFLILLFEIILAGKKKDSVKNLLPHFLFMIPLLALGIYVARVSGVMKHEYYGGSLWNTTFSMSAVCAEYIKLLFLPIGLEIPRHANQYIHTSFFNAAVIVPFTVLSALALTAIYWLVKILRNTTENPPIGWLKKGFTFAVLWFFIALAPVSNILPGQELIAERYLYLPSIGISVLFACAITAALNAPSLQKTVYKGVMTALAIGITVFFTTLTVIRNNDWQDSEKLWNASIRHNPQNAFAIAKLGAYYLYEAKNGDDISREDTLLLKRLSAEKYELALQIDPSMTSPRNELGIYYTNTRDWAKAEEHLLTALQYDPSYAPAWANLATLYYLQERDEEAFQAAQKSVEFAPKRTDYRINIVNYYLRKAEQNAEGREGMLDTAKQELLYMLKLNDMDFDAHLLLGKLYEQKNEPDKAIEQYYSAIKLNETNPDPHARLGRIFAGKSAQGESKLTNFAIAELEKAVEYDSFNAEYYNDLGMVYLELTRSYNKSAELFFTAMKYAPEYNTARTNYARSLAKLKKYNEALMCLDEVLKKYPSDYYAAKAMAFLYFDIGKYSYSEKICIELLKRVPYDYELLIELGHIYRQARNSGFALQYYEEAKKYAPYEKAVKDIDGFIKELKQQ